ncbi:MAG: glycosyltransferase family 1 protein [Pseudomonadales bacterium]|nr:glycosyltransferase family 1 protein [Pseudomonadales bacterium]
MTSPKRIMIVAWGSRGDLQPVTSLALHLKKMGRDVLVFGTPPATDLIQANGIDCVVAKENIEVFVENMFAHADLSDRSIGGFMKLAKFAKQYLNSAEYVATQKEDMKSALTAAHNFKPDVLIVPNLIYAPFMCIAEALQIPVVTYDLQINHPTSEYPLFTMEIGKVPAFLNRGLYKIKALVYPKTIKPKFDMMREICGLPLATYTDGSQFDIWPHKLPQICAVSASLCPQPADWPTQKLMGGWWFLSSGSNYTPAPELVDFLKHKPVYIGFGSMKGNPEFCTMLSTLAIKSLEIAGVKGVMLGGWAGLTRETLDTSTEDGKQLYAWAKENVFEIDSCPHDWLFPQCAAVVHHGGAGTLAAGIRAGCPTIVCAMQGDQPFHGSLVQARGIGRYLGMVGSPTLTPEGIAAGIKAVTTDQAIIAAASAMSEQVQSEEGLANAVRFIDKMATSFSYPWPIKHNPDI